MIEGKIKELVKESLEKLGIESPAVSLEHPDVVTNGDYSTNITLKIFGPIMHGNRSSSLRRNSSLTMWQERPALEKIKNPKKLADEIAQYISNKKPDFLERVEAAGPGFINFYLSRAFFVGKVGEIVGNPENFGKGVSLAGKKVMVEYTDPNPFKVLHIGHLMSNAIGESISRIISFQGAEVKRANYQGDIGLHVAKAIWVFLKSDKRDYNELAHGTCYVRGNEAYEKDANAKAEIQELNKKIYAASDTEVNSIYAEGKRLSLQTFDAVYKKLGTDFVFFFFESEVAGCGVELVKKNTGNIFEISEGATVFKGDKYDPSLHTRVFLNSQGLPTYEAKELGLAKKKEEVYPFDLSFSITGNEIREYFKVLQKAMELVMPELQGKIRHIPHGMLRIPGGKMSSRKGNVITAESLLSAVEAMVHKKLEERELETAEKNKIAEVVAIGAIKYSILRQAIGSDIIFDFDKSISFEGDSGPYLQYSYVRAKSVLAKAEKEGIKPAVDLDKCPEEISFLEKLIYRFPDIVERAGRENSPHFIANYLIEISGAFNGFYAKNQIIDSGSQDSPYRVAITLAFASILKKGLWLLGIEVPERM